jgi:peroxiredoxin Q/BCP
MRFFAFLSLLVGFVFNPVLAGDLKVGDVAPTFSLPDQNGEMHSSAQYIGQWVVLYFYPKDDTPGCTTEACAFRDEYKVISAQNTQVVGVSVDDVDSHAEFSEKYSLPFPLLSDVDGKLAKGYQSLVDIGPINFAKRHSFIIDPEGKIAQIYRSVNASLHSQQVIADLKRLQTNY